MKFAEGMWRVGEGFTPNWMGNVERLAVKDDQVDLLLTKPQGHHGDALNTGTITATVRSPVDGIVAAKFTHWDGEDDHGPHFPLFEGSPKVTIDNQRQKHLKYASGPLSLTVDTSPNSLSFAYTSNDKHLTSHSFRSIGYTTSRNIPIYQPSDGLYAQQTNYLTLHLDLSVHEKIYGLGERFGPFIKNGQSIDMWNEDGGTSSELTYKNIPFYISSRGYGVFINHPGKVMLEVQSERTTRVNISIQGESLEYMIVAGPTIKDVLNRYTALTGRPGLPPAWSYGLWLTTSFTTSYSESTVTSFLDGFKSRGIPLSVFHFDSFWMKSFQWCDFDFDDENFPDPTAYFKRLRERGMKLCVWINPYIAQASPLFSEGKKKGYFIMRADTPRPTVWQWDNWQAGMAVVDFTNREAAEWYVARLRRLMEMGVDAFKTDFGERIPFDPKVVRYSDGSDAVTMYNFYSALYNKAVYEAMEEQGKSGCLFARSATVGGQQWPVHWGGDCESTFEAMAETLRGGLSLGLAGFGFWAHDIGGFEGLPDPVLYKRWVQFGLLGSHSRLHGSSSYRVPWIFEDKYPGEDEKCSKVLRDSVRLKLKLMPYLLRAGLEAREKGVPVMRAMLLEFEADYNVWTVDTQYMLGSELLVAPVFDREGEVRFYVPRDEREGVWRSWWDWKRTYEGGRWYTEKHGFDTLPLLVRPGAVIPINGKMEVFDGDVWEGLEMLANGGGGRRVVEIVEGGDVGRVKKTLTIGEGLQVEGADVMVVDMTK